MEIVWILNSTLPTGDEAVLLLTGKMREILIKFTMHFTLGNCRTFARFYGI